MAKTKPAEWLNAPLLQLYEIAAYIQGQHGYSVADAFLKNAQKRAEHISKYPETGQQSQHFKTVRFTKLGQYHRMYYRDAGSKIIAVYLFDTRQDPLKNKYR